jgi:hypothetical protein
MLLTSFMVGRTQNAFFKGAEIVTPKVLDEFKYSGSYLEGIKFMEQ